MKILGHLTGACSLAAFCLFVLSLLVMACGDDSSGGNGSGGGAGNRRAAGPVKETTPKYLKRREAFFALKPADVGLLGAPRLLGNAVLGVMVETGFPAGVVATIGHADGTTSIYSSTGSSDFVGFGRAIRVAAATKRMVGAAERTVSAMTPADTRPMPGSGEVIVYIVTAQGVFTAGTTMDELDRGTHFLYPVVAASKDVYVQVRKAYQEQIGGPKQ